MIEYSDQFFFITYVSLILKIFGIEVVSNILYLCFSLRRLVNMAPASETL